MIKIIIIFFVLYVFLFVKRNKIKIKLRTFFKKGMCVESGHYGVYCYVGKQGSGKTYSVIEYLFQNQNKKIYANIKSIRDLQYTYIANFDDLLKIENDTDDNIIIFYDEIFSALTKQDKMSKEVLSFLSQMRKRKIIFLTTAQEWLEINITLRRYVRYQINCSILTIPLFKKSFLLKVFHDGDLIHWDQLENDYVSPIIETTFSKMCVDIANSYDTYEVVHSTDYKRRQAGSCANSTYSYYSERSEQERSDYERSEYKRALANDLRQERAACYTPQSHSDYSVATTTMQQTGRWSDKKNNTKPDLGFWDKNEINKKDFDLNEKE